MIYKKSVEYIYVRSVEVEAESLEEAMDLFDNGDWYDADGGEGDPIYYVAELGEDDDIDNWKMIK